MPGLIRPHGGACRPDDDRRLGHHRACRLGACARADRLPADRGPGLSPRRRSAARRRRAGAHAEGARPGLRHRAHGPGVDHVVTIAGVSALDNNARLANAGVAYVVLKDWSERDGPAHALWPAVGSARRRRCARDRAAAAADPGHRQCRRLHHAGRAARRQHRFRQAAEHHQHDRRQRANRRARCSGCRPRSARSRRNCASTSIASRRRRCTSRSIRCSRRSRPISDRPTWSSSTNSAACSRSMRRPTRRSGCGRAISRTFAVRNQQGDMIPLGTLVTITPAVGAAADQPLQSLSVVERHRLPAAGFSSGEALRLMEQNAAQTLPPGTAHRMDRDVLSGEGRRQPDVFRVRDGVAAGLSGARRAIRKLVRAAVGDPLGAAGAGRSGAGADWRCASTTISTPRSASSC